MSKIFFVAQQHELYIKLCNKYFFYIRKNFGYMKSSLGILIFFFLRREIIIQVNKIKFLYYFVKEFSILRLLCYLIDKSVIPSRDKIFRNYILKNSQKWKFKREATSNKTNKYILITNIVNHLGYAIPEIVIGKNLVEMFKSDGMALLKRYDLRSKLIFESFGIKKFIFLDDLNFFMRTKYILRAYSIIKSCKTMDNFLKFSLNKVNIGQAVYDHYLRYTGIGTSNEFNPKFYLFLSEALLNYYKIKKYNTEFKFLACVISERQFIPGSIIYQSLLVNGTNVYSRSGPSNTFSVRKYSDTREMWKCRERYSKKLYDEISNSIKEKAVEIGGTNIEKRFKGIPEYDVFHDYFERQDSLKGKKYKKKEKITVTKKELCNKLGWNQNIPIVAILASDLTDGVFDSTWSLFRDRLTWLRETLLEVKNINSVNWLLKPHPNDEKNKVVTDTISEYKKICSNYKHILPFPDNVSIASIPKFVHVVLTHSGSASYEYPCMGIPVFQAAESICSGRGFTIDPGSKKEYFELIHKIEKINKLNKHQIDQAKIFSFIYSELTRINVNLINSYDRRTTFNDKNFFSAMIKLLDNYKEEEDLLKKMMKIQEKNNDRHTINYNLLK